MKKLFCDILGISGYGDGFSPRIWTSNIIESVCRKKEFSVEFYVAIKNTGSLNKEAFDELSKHHKFDVEGDPSDPMFWILNFELGTIWFAVQIGVMFPTGKKGGGDAKIRKNALDFAIENFEKIVWDKGIVHSLEGIGVTVDMFRKFVTENIINKKN